MAQKYTSTQVSGCINALSEDESVRILRYSDIQTRENKCMGGINLTGGASMRLYLLRNVRASAGGTPRRTERGESGDRGEHLRSDRSQDA